MHIGRERISHSVWICACLSLLFFCFVLFFDCVPYLNNSLSGLVLECLCESVCVCFCVRFRVCVRACAFVCVCAGVLRGDSGVCCYQWISQQLCERTKNHSIQPHGVTEMELVVVVRLSGKYYIRCYITTCNCVHNICLMNKHGNWRQLFRGNRLSLLVQIKFNRLEFIPLMTLSSELLEKYSIT